MSRCRYSTKTHEKGADPCDNDGDNSGKCDNAQPDQQEDNVNQLSMLNDPSFQYKYNTMQTFYAQ